MSEKTEQNIKGILEKILKDRIDDYNSINEDDEVFKSYLQGRIDQLIDVFQIIF